MECRGVTLRGFFSLPRKHDHEKHVFHIGLLFMLHPQVTEDGDIVYVFPSLQTSAIADAGTSNSRRELERLQGLKVSSLSLFYPSRRLFRSSMGCPVDRFCLVELVSEG